MKYEQPYINHFNKETVKLGDLEFKPGEIQLIKRITTDDDVTFYFEVKR